MMTHKRSNMVSLGRVPSSNAFQFRLFNCVMDDRPKKLVHLLSEAGDYNSTSTIMLTNIADLCSYGFIYNFFLLLCG